jgi:hypothetical protein
VLHQVVAEVVTDRVVVHTDRASRRCMPSGLWSPACSARLQQVFSGQVGQQSEHERSGAAAGFYAGEPTGDTAQQLVEDLLPAGRSYAVAGGHRVTSDCVHSTG